MPRSPLPVLAFALLTVFPWPLRAQPAAEVVAQHQEGRKLLAANNLEEALKVFDALISAQPDFTEAYIDRGNAEFGLKKWTDAEADYAHARLAIEAMPASDERSRLMFRVYTNLGNIENHYERWTSALALLDRAIALNPDGRAPYEGRSFAYAMLGENEKSAADLRKIAELLHETDVTYLAAAQKAHDSGDERKANDIIIRALAVNAKNDDVYALRGDVYLATNPKMAGQFWTKALELNPKNAVALCGLGELALQAGDKTGSKSYLDRALQVDPKLPVAWLRLGNWTVKFLDQTHTKEALNAYTRAIEAGPQLANTYYDRAHLYYEIGDYKRAVDDYTAAIARDPSAADAFNNRGMTYKRLGEGGQALADLKQAVKLNPHYGSAYFNLANIYNSNGDLTMALESIAHARQEMPSDEDTRTLMNRLFNKMQVGPYSVLNQGVAAYKQGDYTGAVQCYTTVLSYDPASRDALFDRALAYEFLGETERVFADLDALLRYYPNDAEAHFERAEVSRKTGKLDLAEKHYAAAKTLDPKMTREARGTADSQTAEEIQARMTTMKSTLAMLLKARQDGFIAHRAIAFGKDKEGSQQYLVKGTSFPGKPAPLETITVQNDGIILYHALFGGPEMIAMLAVCYADALTPEMKAAGYAVSQNGDLVKPVYTITENSELVSKCVVDKGAWSASLVVVAISK